MTFASNRLRRFSSGAVTTALPIAAVVGSCAAHVLAAGSRPPMTERPAVVVLGYPARRNGGPHPIQRWRVDLAVDAVRRFGASTVVFTGGRTGGDRSEAEIMADLFNQQMTAVPMIEPGGGAETGLDRLTVLLEDRSVSTWENVFHTMPLVDGSTAVTLVSDPLHAARARRYWLNQQPEDDGRIFVFGGRGFFDHWWLKVPTAGHALIRELLTGSRNLLGLDAVGRRRGLRRPNP